MPGLLQRVVLLVHHIQQLVILQVDRRHYDLRLVRPGDHAQRLLLLCIGRRHCNPLHHGSIKITMLLIALHCMHSAALRRVARRSCLLKRQTI